MKNPFLISIILMLFVATIFSCDKDDDDIKVSNSPTAKTELTETLDELLISHEVPGFAVSIIKANEILYQNAFGKADLATDEPFTNQTTQPIASVSKTFIGVAIVKAIEQGHFTLDTDINDILPFEIKNPKQPNAIIRVRHLVTHTSGMVDNFGLYVQNYHILPGEDLSEEGAQILHNGFGLAQRPTISLEDFLVDYYFEGGSMYSTDNFTDAAPGTAWSYSNAGASLAAFLIESATGQSFQQYVKQYIFNPLEMNNSAYGFADLNPDNLATLYWEKNIPLPRYSKDSYPDGNMNTSNEDLGKFLMDMMKGAAGQSNTLFSKESYDLLFEALLPMGMAPVELGDSHSLFWVLKDDFIGHTGGEPGVSTNLKFDADGKTGYFLISTMDSTTDEHDEAFLKYADEVYAAIEKFLDKN